MANSIISKRIRCNKCKKQFTIKDSRVKYCPSCKNKPKKPIQKPKVLYPCIGYNGVDERSWTAPDAQHQACTSDNGRPKTSHITILKEQYQCIKCRGKKSKVRRRLNLHTNWFFYRFYREALRAKTIEFVNNLDDLRDYLEISKAVRAFNGLVYNKENGRIKRSAPTYNICHCIPINGKNYIGLTTLSNIFIGKAEDNRKAGNLISATPDIGNNCIRRDLLKEAFKITKSICPSTKAFIQTLEKYYGVKELQNFASHNNLTPKRTTAPKNDEKIPYTVSPTQISEVTAWNYYNCELLPREFILEVDCIYRRVQRSRKEWFGLGIRKIAVENFLKVDKFQVEQDHFLQRGDYKHLENALKGLIHHWLN